jgi:hypothetical protein
MTHLNKLQALLSPIHLSYDEVHLKFNFFWVTSQFDSSIAQKNETMEAPPNRRFYFAVQSSSPFGLPI